MDRDSFEEQYGETIDEYAEDYGLYDSYLYETVMEKVWLTALYRTVPRKQRMTAPKKQTISCK